MSRVAARSARRIATGACLVLALAACDSSNDDDGGGPMEPGDGTDMTGELDVSGDFAEIVARGADDEPYALDADALAADLSTRFGDATAEPLDIGDDDDAQMLAARRR